MAMGVFHLKDRSLPFSLLSVKQTVAHHTAEVWCMTKQAALMGTVLAAMRLVKLQTCLISM